MDFKSYLQRSAQQIDEQLDLILSQFLSGMKKTSPKLIPFALGLISSCKGGKRIRGVLVKLGYEIGSSKFKVQNSKFKESEVLKTAAAIEILHTAILIQDDIIDQSPTRRGRASLYKILGGGHKGESLALGVADAGLYLPIQIIAGTHFLEEYKIRALNHLSQVVVNTAWGQVLELDGKEDINLIQRLKTAYYTISGPLILGAILSGAEDSLLDQLGKFGENLGIAYQIQDDILDNEVGYIGGVDQAKKEALKNVTYSKKVIPDIAKDEKMSKLLEQMADYLVGRRR